MAIPQSATVCPELGFVLLPMLVMLAFQSRKGCLLWSICGPMWVHSTAIKVPKYSVLTHGFKDLMVRGEQGL